MKWLEERVLVVIGGTSGLGWSAARAFVQEGARVVVVGRTQDGISRAENEFEGAIRGVCGDARDPSTARAAIELAIRVWGEFHGLYHVAGGSGRKFGDGPLHTLTASGWEETLNWNLTSVFHSNQAAVQTFLERGQGGAILNLGSVLGSSPSPQYFSTLAYSAAKAAMIGFTRSAASFYATKNIRMNVLAPALVETPMSTRALGDAEIRRFIAFKQPLDGGRVGHPSDLDGAAVFLMSERSRYMTGQVITVDGGWSVSDGSAQVDSRFE